MADPRKLFFSSEQLKQRLNTIPAWASGRRRGWNSCFSGASMGDAVTAPCGVRLLIVGHSHADCYGGHRGRAPDDYEMNPIDEGRGFWRIGGHPKNLGYWDVAVELSKTFRTALCWHGNGHWTEFLFLEKRFDFTLASRPELVVDHEVELVSELQVREVFQPYLTDLLENDVLTRMLDAGGPTPIVLGTPPPKGDEEAILRGLRSDSAITEQASKLGLDLEQSLAPAHLRLKLWFLLQQMMSESAERLGVEFWPVSASAMTKEGYLRPEYWAADVTHANAAYGALMLDDYERRLSALRPTVEPPARAVQIFPNLTGQRAGRVSGMGFQGAIEAVSRDTISGWAGYKVDGSWNPVQVQLRFRTRGSTDPAALQDRDGRTGFKFQVPLELQNLGWPEFLDEFDGVVARCPKYPDAGDWLVPLFKSVLSALDPDNRTGLLAARRKEYHTAPKADGRIAVFTMAYNEHLVLPLWARYYASHFGAENLFVIDHGSSPSYIDVLPAGVNVVRLPRDMFDNWLIARVVAFLQRFLLEAYDSVVYTDSDEFICATSEALAGRSFSKFLLELPGPVGITTGYDLMHDIATEGAFDTAIPLLEQRRFMSRNPAMDKPLVARVPLNWVPGFHTAAEGGQPIDGLYLLHLRWFDLDHALRKGGFYRESAWNDFDIEHRLAAYQRQGEQEIVQNFRKFSDVAAKLRHSVFDPQEQYTVVPDWMRKAINI
ncbi:glycosyltransferase family 2 protein [Mycobacterium gordonae]|uniref:glycosyltransferase family 2 protein n=1 Tax=Mycobacterium gordonae TaxID=1778 RepID=UPI00210A735B|nr:glycosyltransferase family 2 protein [Mycobacterium gordonae]